MIYAALDVDDQPATAIMPESLRADAEHSRWTSGRATLQTHGSQVVQQCQCHE